MDLMGKLSGNEARPMPPPSMNPMCGESQAMSSKQIPEAMQRLCEEISYAEEAVRRLFEILSPFTHKPPVNPQKDQVEPLLVPFAEQIRTNTKRIRDVREVITFLADNFQGN